MRWANILMSALLLTLPGLAYAENIDKQKDAADSNEIEYKVCYDFKPRLKWHQTLFRVKPFETVLTVNLPKTIPSKQEIIEIKFDPEPDRVFSQSGNDYADFAVSVGKKEVNIKIHVRANVFRYDLATAMKQGQKPSENEPNLTLFLQPERMIESNDAPIQKLAEDINGTSELEIVRSIYDFVISYLEVDVSRLKGIGAAKTAWEKKGMCIDYCDLFVALCRARQIPARVVAGYRAHFTVSPKHSWVEVYLPEYGWVPFDPSQLKTKTKDHLDSKFYNFEPQLLYFTKIRNDTVLQYNYFYIYSGLDKKETFSRIYPPVEKIEFIKPMHKTHDSLEDEKRAKTYKGS